MADVIFTDEASADFTAAVDWYRERSNQVAARFELAVDAAIETIIRFPTVGFSVGNGRRFLALVSRFPYYLIYRANEAGVTVAAIVHNRRSPQTWADR